MLSIRLLILSLRLGTHSSRISTCPLLLKLKQPGMAKRRVRQPTFRMNESFQFLDYQRCSLQQWSDVYEDNDWSDIYPTEKPFDPYLIGLPIRAGGHRIRKELPPLAEGNVVFWEDTNFFHLTPPAIQKHCEALKPLCTEWPSDLPYCPIEVETVDFLLPGNERYHQDGRHVRMEIDFDSLNLSARPREKMLELLGDKYDIDKNVIKLESRRCPTKTQNKEYLYYLLKVLYYEANRTEKWEEMRLVKTESVDKTSK
ncbi:28S ribosomal protein S35, mitochondrial-like [Oopsacas minuta]|uniref:28S ribosomal protein S35, mitochondrial-like n=1 Tax=Oopsacas minuta TaxID=111878 RepID=A0AAV7JDH4_9METZ|nr:28S ribosomal protein S35, mitochondrial-like [Oopsacas minuta]